MKENVRTREKKSQEMVGKVGLENEGKETQTDKYTNFNLGEIRFQVK